MKTIVVIVLSVIFSASAFAFKTQQSVDLPDYKNTDCKFTGTSPDSPAAVKAQPGRQLRSLVKEGEKNDLDLTDRELRRAVRRVKQQFLLLSILEALTFTDDGINLAANFLGEDAVLESDNLDDEEDDIKYTVKARFKNINITDLFIPGKLRPEKDVNGIPVWHLTLIIEEIGTCADIEATADTTNREKDGSYLDLIPAGTASTSGEACLTVKNARVPVDVTIAMDEDDEGRVVSKFTVIPPARENELDEGTKKLKVQLDDLTAYDFAVSQLVLELLEPAVEDLLYEELNIDELLSEAAEEVLEIPLSFGEK